MKCKICESQSCFLFTETVIQKYKVDYFRCVNCGFIQTENAYWLKEAYNDAISSIDVGLVHRNLYFSNVVEAIIKKKFDYTNKFLDYGGGYGLFVRLMRDKGLDFYRQDLYCENIFAKYLDITDLPSGSKFELVTAFEVFEHLEAPIEQIAEIFKYSNSLLFSTELQPAKTINSAKDWWYFVPESGQHISFYTERSLQIIAEKFNCHLYSEEGIHILTPKIIDPDLLYYKKNTPSIFYKLLNKAYRIFTSKNKEIHLNSLLEKDFEFAKNKTATP